jgi:hypothetical protein
MEGDRFYLSAKKAQIKIMLCKYYLGYSDKTNLKL